MSRSARNKNPEETEEVPPEGTGAAAAEFLMMILPMLRDFLPLLIEKWSESTDRPTLRALEDDNRRLRHRVEFLDRRVLWLTMFQVVQALFFLFFIVLVALKVF